MPKPLDLEGRKYGRLTAIRFIKSNKHGQRVWSFECSCGNYTEVAAYAVISGHTSSCGCYGAQQRKKSVKTHGKRQHPLYNVWSAMLCRCRNKLDAGYKYYGGRGITVCEEWEKSFAIFFEWAITSGWKKGLEIDRFDNDGNYTPKNCSFVTRRLQMQNKRQLRKGRAGFLGVGISKSGCRFRARYGYKNKCVHVGYYDTAIEAAVARHKSVISIGENYMLDDKLI